MLDMIIFARQSKGVLSQGWEIVGENVVVAFSRADFVALQGLCRTVLSGGKITKRDKTVLQGMLHNISMVLSLMNLKDQGTMGH